MEVREKFFNRELFILLGIFLVIGIVFFVSLGALDPPVFSATGEVLFSPGESDFSFGIVEILFSVVFGIFMTGFLVWTKSISIKNAYLGVGIGLIGMIVLGYAFYLRFRGPYSTGFMIVTGAIVLFYLGKNFLKFKKFDRYIEGEFDEGWFIY